MRAVKNKSKPLVLTLADMEIDDSVKTRINDATKSLISSYSTRLALCDIKYVSVICDYISALRSEIKLSNGYRRNILNTLIALSRVGKNKKFEDFTRQDVIIYLNQFRKEDSEDPTKRWVGTYNTVLIHICKFFKWLYFPDVEPAKRGKPEVIQNLPKLKRTGHISDYKPSDMWDAEDNLLFLKYCPNTRDRCYHGMEVDTGARPHELLNLRIKDVEFIDSGNGRYARILVNGKTGQRPLVLIDSIPYVTQWLSEHAQRDNGEALLLPNLETGSKVQVDTIRKAYLRYKRYFTKLLSKDIPEEDKKRIKNLLKKPWNPYVHRHSALTEKSGILSSDAKLRQYAGWSITSNMYKRYQHFSGGEAANDLLRAKGIIKEDNQAVNILSPKACPSCREPNEPYAQFCLKCNFILSFNIYQKSVEEKERNDLEVSELKNQISEMKVMMNDLASGFRVYKKEFELYRDQFGSRSLTEKELEKIREKKKALAALPP
ncbi:MAG TPA: tyrosine-type recombinase/integrase [Candidatus Bathyarchaeia archaeon]|nr:tyrosine-type recombinase/integrase [Candidatus Bathyarchaeia archaeon]